MSIQSALAALGASTTGHDNTPNHTPQVEIAVQSKDTQIPINTSAPVEPPKAPEPKVETTPEPPKPKLEDKESQKFAALARKERAIQAEKAKVEARFKELEGKEAKIKAFEAASSNKDYSKAAEILGLSYEEWTNYILNENKPTPELEVKGVRKELEDLKKNLQDERKLAEDKEKKAAQDKYNEVMEQFKGEVSNYLLTHQDRYELIHLTGTQDVVTAVIEQHFQNTAKTGKPKVMTIEEASNLVEADLEVKARKAAATKKLQAKGTADNTSPKESASKQDSKSPEKASTDRPNSTPQFRTLNNNLTSTSAPAQKGPMSDEDRIKKALAKL